MKAPAQEQRSSLPEGFEYRLHLGPAATSRELKSAPRHRWFYFPHSFSPRLVFQLFDEWRLREGDRVLDNFVGSGTTLLAAQERGLTAVGVDMSPLAVMVSNTKASTYDPASLRCTLKQLVPTGENPASSGLDLIPRLLKAYTDEERRALASLLHLILALQTPHRAFFLLALIWTARTYSRAVSDGGWFRWQDWPDRSPELLDAFRSTVDTMVDDVEATKSKRSATVEATLADARRLPLPTASVDAAITSPPYANRHDYSRVFHVDLLLLGLAEAAIKQLRYSSIRSHVEAKAPNGFEAALQQLEEPKQMPELLTDMDTGGDKRVSRMLKGYFQDLSLSLAEASRVLRPSGHVAYIVGNVQHAGVMVPVDQMLAEMAPEVGLVFEKAWVLRLRGNSAQQMSTYGRQPSRETAVIFKKV